MSTWEILGLLVAAPVALFIGWLLVALIAGIVVALWDALR